MERKKVINKLLLFKLLIVENERNARQELSDLLGSHGYKTSVATSGKHAVTNVMKKEGKIDFILMDIKMPGQFDGIDAVERIQHLYPDIPVIFVSAFSDLDVFQQRVKDLDLKILGWVDKPIIGRNKEKLLNLISQEIEKNKMRDLLSSIIYSDSSQDGVLQQIRKMSDEQNIDTIVEVMNQLNSKQPFSKYNKPGLLSFLNLISFESRKSHYEKQFPGYYIAFHKGSFVDYHQDREELIKNVYEELGTTDLFLPLVGIKKRVLNVRSPKRV